ncbi:DUF4215 domain-containing protein [Corallococcus terminator]
MPNPRVPSRLLSALFAALFLTLSACGDDPPSNADAGPRPSEGDASTPDSGTLDSGTPDSGGDAGTPGQEEDSGTSSETDGGSGDGGGCPGSTFAPSSCPCCPPDDDGGPGPQPEADAGPLDAGPVDAGPPDAGPVDGGPVDAGPVDAGPVDAGPVDAGPVDAGPVDAGPPDAGGPVCGDGTREAPETCDDGNTTSNDGCDSSCALEPGWNCPTNGRACQAAACGDNLIAGNEECEDGNIITGDGCDNTCRLESGYKCPLIGQPCSRTTCGDQVVEGTEQCDDGNNDTGDGCSPLCMKEPRCTDGVCDATCGDGVLLPNDTTEECDDGNTRAHDGCSPTCRFEPGFTCVNVEQEPPQQVSLPIVYRDFRGYDLPASGPLPRGHIDFENKNGTERGLVKNLLSVAGKPDYAKEGQPSTTTSGAANFAQWFLDTTFVNKPVVSTLTLQRQMNGAYLYDNAAFYPLDTLGWVAAGFEPLRMDSGTPAQPRNYSFTSETRYWFEYKGTEVLTFRGDDDVWVFVNRILALDLGGIHGAEQGTVTLSTQAARLGLTLGGIYEVAVFQAERHTTGSSYRLTLNNFATRRTLCIAQCGNNQVDAFEECDDGVNDGSYGQCAPGCVLGPRCGDGTLQDVFGEECDDGNLQSRDGCSATCKVEIG